MSSFWRRLGAAAVIAAASTTLVGRADAQLTPNLELLPPVPKSVGFDQHLGDSLPLDTQFKDENGQAVSLRDYFGQKPVILSFAYFDCPMLCGLSLQGLAGALKGMNLDVAHDFNVLTVSFESKDTTAKALGKKKSAMSRYGRPGAEAGWHFLTGDSSAISALTTAAGFRYEWDEESKQYAHPAGVVVVTPEGKISHYLFGVEYAPKDLRLALVEASQGKVGNVVDQLLLLCYHYDPKAGRYGPVAIGAMRTGGALTLLGLGAFFILNRSDKKRRDKDSSAKDGGN